MKQRDLRSHWRSHWSPSGANPKDRESFRRECEGIAEAFEEEGAAAVARRYALGPSRVQFEVKDPRGHQEFTRMLAEHSAMGSAFTMRGFQKERPSLYDVREEMARMNIPVVIMVGDEDHGAIEASIMMKRCIPTSGLVVFPKSGHTLNLEEPALFNSMLLEFIETVRAGAWTTRDPRSLAPTTTGMLD